MGDKVEHLLNLRRCLNCKVLPQDVDGPTEVTVAAVIGCWDACCERWESRREAVNDWFGLQPRMGYPRECGWCGKPREHPEYSSAFCGQCGELWVAARKKRRT